MSMSSRADRKTVGDSYDKACLCVELVLASDYRGVYDVVTSLPTHGERDALLGAAFILAAEVLRDLSEDDDQARRRLHAIREAAQAVAGPPPSPLRAV